MKFATFVRKIANFCPSFAAAAPSRRFRRNKRKRTFLKRLKPVLWGKNSKIVG